METDNTILLIGKALDAALMRQTAIARNISNIHTDNYRSVQVNFEEQLHNLDEMQQQRAEPFYEQTDQPPVLEEQLAQGVVNATQYRALIKGLNHKLGIMKLAIQGSHA